MNVIILLLLLVFTGVYSIVVITKLYKENQILKAIIQLQTKDLMGSFTDTIIFNDKTINLENEYIKEKEE